MNCPESGREKERERENGNHIEDLFRKKEREKS